MLHVAILWDFINNAVALDDITVAWLDARFFPLITSADRKWRNTLITIITYSSHTLILMDATKKSDFVPPKTYKKASLICCVSVGIV